MNKKSDWRIYFLLVILFLIYGAIVYRLFSIQVLQHGALSALAQGQYEIIKKTTPQRGDIFVQDKNYSSTPLATARGYPFVFLVPKEIENKEKIADSLSGILGLDKSVILDKADKIGDPFVLLKSKLDDVGYQAIRDLNFKGVYLGEENLRWYPQGDLASHVLGFVGYKGDQRLGQYGVEGYWEEELAGKPGFLKTERDAAGRLIFTGDYTVEPAIEGSQLFLTVDPNIQFMAEQKLEALLKKWQAPSGSIVVTDPKTGAIKAMASFPDFNSNEYGKVENIDDFLNPVTQKLYEPGSIFKPITMAAGLDTGKITPETSYVDTGSVTLNGYTITNAAGRSYGLSTMNKVLEKSINTGAVFAEHLIGNETFKKYVEAFGFNRPTGVDLAGEVSGNISNLGGKQDINFATASFGQGIAVTPMEIISAIGAIANSGKMMRPYVVEKIVHSDGREEKIEPSEIRQVISEQSANKLTAMLVSTVRNGYDKVKIKGYFIAGKTGTAQIPNFDSRGYSEQTIHSFIGYAPAYDPKFLIFIKMDKPLGITFASDSLAPVFTEMAMYLFGYYGIAPDENGN
ncbi:MAG: penicillin-binding protein 2 [bacterium]